MPHLQVVETTVYTFAELTEQAKERARSWYRDGALDYQWYDSVYEDAQEMGKLIGIEINNKAYKTMGGRTPTEPAIYFSGFSSQGDGACFEGTYAYQKQSVKAIKEHAPLDARLHQIALELQQIQRRHFYKLSAYVRHSGHYYHEMCTAIDVYKDGDDFGDTRYTRHGIGRELNHDSTNVVEALRRFMQWIYRRLEEEYDYLMSDEQVDESIEANEYEFTEDGSRA